MNENEILENGAAEEAVSEASAELEKNVTSSEGVGSVEESAALDEALEEADDSIERNVRLMSPTRMVIRRFFRSKLSIVGLIMIIGLFALCWIGPLLYGQEPTDADYGGKIEYTEQPVTITRPDGTSYTFVQVVETEKPLNNLAKPSSEHILGTDKNGYDIFARIMHGGRISLTISFLAVFIITIFGVIFGGLAGYFGGVIDDIIMRICDILMCLPGFPILLIVSTIIESMGIDLQYRIYYLMGFLTIISWSGTARLVRGQILSLREQEYMVAAEAMGYSTGRKIFKHLIPNVMPQLIVAMTMSLGSMILYEASLSYLGLGAPEKYAAWGTMINAANDTNILQNYFNVWGPPGFCIIIAVLGFNFVGDGLRDALDPKSRR